METLTRSREGGGGARGGGGASNMRGEGSRLHGSCVHTCNVQGQHTVEVLRRIALWNIILRGGRYGGKYVSSI